MKLRKESTSHKQVRVALPESFFLAGTAVDCTRRLYQNLRDIYFRRVGDWKMTVSGHGMMDEDNGCILSEFVEVVVVVGTE